MAKKGTFSEVEAHANSLLWKIYPQNWFEQFPFYFVLKYPDDRLTLTNGINLSSTPTEVSRFYLPCPPQSMTVQDMSTSDSYATLGGVVEETSAGVFSNIILSGTTGMALNDQSGTGDPLSTKQRKLFSEATGGTNILSRIGQSAIGAIEGAVQGLTGNAEPALPFANYGSAVPTPDKNTPVESFFSGRGMDVSTAISKLGAFLPGVGDETKGQAFTNGFSWSIALRQYFQKYQALKQQFPEIELYFVDEKRNNQSRVVVRDFRVQNVASQPMIQSYNIVLKAWNTQDIEGTRIGPVDRLKTDLKDVQTLNAASAILSVAKTIKKLRRPLDLAGSMVSATVSSKLQG